MRDIDSDFSGTIDVKKFRSGSACSLLARRLVGTASGSSKLPL